MEWQEYPIIHLDFLGVDYKKFGLEQELDDTLDSMANSFNVELHKKSIKGKLGELIEILSKKEKVVVLIDEYDKHIQHREAYYHSLVYIALKMSMMDVQAEIQTALGRSDIVVSIGRFVYIIEFKMSSAQIALDQIEEKQYYAPFLKKDKTVLLLGIGLDESKRNIGDWKIKEVGSETRTDIPKEPQEEKQRMAKQMVADGLPIELIVKYSGLSVEEIKGL